MKKYLIFGLVLILLSSIAYGWSDYLLIDDLTTSVETGNSFGVEISINTTGDFLFNITKESGDESIRCALYETDGTLIINKTFDGDICSFVTNVTADEKYFMMGMRDSSSTLKYKNPGGTPYTSAYGYFTYHDQIRYNGESWDRIDSLGTIRNLNLTYLEESETYFELTAKNVYNDSSISNFTAQITNSTTAVNISTTNGTIVWNINDTINISLINANETGNLFFNQSYTEISTDSNYEMETYQSILYGYAQDSQSETTLNNFNVTIGSHFNTSSNNYTTFYLDAGNLSYSGRAEYYPTNSTGNINIEQLTTYNVTFNFSKNKTNVLTFYDAITTNAISGAEVTITYPSSSSETLTTNTSGSINFSYFKNSIDDFGNYTISIAQQGYISATTYEIINKSNAPLNKSYNVSRTYITFNLYDRTTTNLITSNVDLVFIGIDNFSTSKGTYYLTNLSIVSGEQTIQAISDDFETEQQTFTFSNQENVSVNLYLLNSSLNTSGSLFVTIIDEFYRYIQNAKVELLEYSTDSKSFVKVSECQSNSNGECVFGIELNTKTYIVIASKTIDGLSYSAQSSSSGEIIKLDNEVRQLLLKLSYDFEKPAIDYLVVDIDEYFSNNISDINVSFYTLDNFATVVCLEFLQDYTTYKTTAYKVCGDSSSSIVTIGTSFLLNRNISYIAKIYQNHSGNIYNLDSYTYPALTTFPNLLNNNNFVEPFILLLWIVLLALSFYTKNITLFGIGTIILSWFEFALFQNWLIVSASVLKTILAIFIIYISRKKQEEF